MSYNALPNESKSINPAEQRNQEHTIWIGGLDQQVTESLLYELCTQCGIVKSIHIPMDKVTGQSNGYGFVEYNNAIDCQYAYNVLNNIKLFDKPIRINRAGKYNTANDTAVYNAIVFVGNLSDTTNEKLLYDTFIYFGNIINIKLVTADTTDTTTKHSNYAFVTYELFDSADNAIEAMNGQYLDNKQINVTYSYLKDSKTERHGSEEERLLERTRLQTQAETAAQQTTVPNGIASVPPVQQPVQQFMQPQQPVQPYIPQPAPGIPMPYIPPQSVYNNQQPTQQYPVYPPPQQFPPAQPQQGYPMPPPQTYSNTYMPPPGMYPAPLPPGLQPQQPPQQQYPPPQTVR